MPPPTIYPIKKLIAITPEMAKAIEDYRFANRLKAEAEAIRQLIEAGLSAGAPLAPSGSSDPGGASKPGTTAKSPAPRARKPGRQAEPAQPQSKEAQIRALREQGAQQ
jgi:hypothetical protein